MARVVSTLCTLLFFMALFSVSRGSSGEVDADVNKWRCTGYLGMCSIEKCNEDCCINTCIKVFKYQGNVWGHCEEIPGTAQRRCKCDFDC
ncbi:hypothetical protein DCAR_0102169 [Daucus carota subsp. sativus]|uniref:Defensin-like protein n=1 Tax=Daucus carota subsp. sativus TaxID=79200 RepID=A0AAF1AJY9_DAUCS|nr:hypothetical protein DCAR_0102169 [Daucus carota subsp. sativus]